MQTVQDVIESAKKALGVESDNAFAAKLGITRGLSATGKGACRCPTP